ncbi:LytR/AlgR family response regulator transcription factor [Pedobacter deserti]|uniref:LytR/AlgR family response regulator transcription factor n=1 Tax=Pedobacter deserti TaxID=2817382 RepID=UPI00210EE7FD|nr:LytTR family DNA-binding domain-containing protein [Pedobacter sp. SYSU D00382]
MIAIAIDDEPIALDVVKSHASKVPFINLSASFTNAFSAIQYLQANQVDLIFLDIKMPDISGIDFFNSLSHKPMVIFTTAYSEHAITGFELNAVDYLLKPFSLSRFLKACNKALDLYQFRSSTSHAHTPTSIFIKDGYEQVKVNLSDILYIEASGNYTRLVLTSNKTLSTRLPFNDMLNSMPLNSFVRIHRTYAVARDRITKFDKYQVWLGTQPLPVGQTYSQSLQTLIL